METHKGPSGAVERCFDDVEMSVSLSGDRYQGINGGGWRLMAGRYQRCQGAPAQDTTRLQTIIHGRQPAIPILALDYMDSRRASACF